MATNNAPKHDFAPAWLKIPNAENSKPSGVNKGKRFPPGPTNKYRHHSVDDDYYAYYNGYPYYPGYSYHDIKYGMHYSSQPTLVRANGQRDTKYQHPHARYGVGQGMNVGYPPYYDFLPPFENYYSDREYYNNNNYPSQRGSSKKSYYEKDGRSNSKEGKEKDERKEKETDKPFKDDFPSLNGDEENIDKPSKQVNGTGVWENPPLSKAPNTKPTEENGETSQSKVLRDPTFYKYLVPSKATTSRRPTRVNGSFPRDEPSFAALKISSPTAISTNSVKTSKESSTQPSTPPIDILNTRFVTQPKTLADKKSHFLKTLRQEDSDKVGKKECDDVTNGVGALELDDSNLSSSLEAEQRLLREMGWNEADEETYVITEDDMKEFQTLSKHLQNQRPARNGITKPAIPKTWSPKHVLVYQPNPSELNDTLSSSDSESDVEN
ncbi:vasculin-like protein 1 [Dreissena polymorpha]|uniref:Vasculin n=1 Tax=Dreissena polymorpha TaxID=45954 RepID=A0A9D3Y7J6_DREPO|nr:vasculin-like protein 1 [Dreissena polymorpha]XP_052256559.1 vasculin-like protein 1 [Dreissena polymorpha]KAH3694677.1 hypothetical protein DPMN_082118 [Dreissena polymorpha]